LQGKGRDEDEGGLAMEIQPNRGQSIRDHGDEENENMDQGDPVGKIRAKVFILVNDGRC